MPPRSLRVAVIGAGAAGLAAARELRAEGHVPVVLERGAGVGGTWIYEPEADGHSSMYASLRTNLPREVMGFLDFPFSSAHAHRDRELESESDPRRFPAHREVLRYIEDFARRFDLYGLVRLRAEVIAVGIISRPEPGDKDEQRQSGCSWSVRWRNEGERKEEEETFDAVVVCNGHYAEPRVADIPGIDAWPGRQMHSHSYRVPDPFLGQVVVIVGAKNSGADISREIAGVAREVHMADRAAPPDTCRRLPGYDNLWLRSMVECAREDGGVVFRDGSSVKADVILHCTGYTYRFPFLPTTTSMDSSGMMMVSVEENRVHPLYKHVFPPHLAPTLSFIGLPFKVVPFPLFQLQSSWVAGVLSGRIQLPSREEMMRDVEAWYSELEAMGWPKRYTHCLKHNQFEYDNWLAEQTGHLSNSNRVEDWRRRMYDAVSRKKRDCPETYRDEWDDHHLLQQANQDFQKYYLL